MATRIAGAAAPSPPSFSVHPLGWRLDRHRHRASCLFLPGHDSLPHLRRFSAVAWPRASPIASAGVTACRAFLAAVGAGSGRAGGFRLADADRIAHVLKIRRIMAVPPSQRNGYIMTTFWAQARHLDRRAYQRRCTPCQRRLGEAVSNGHNGYLQVLATIGGIGFCWR